MPKPASTRPAYKMLTCIYLCRTLLFFAPYADFLEKIKGITGQTPNEFLSTVRLKRAAFLLRSDLTLSISEISDKTGFSSPRYFGRCFKEAYGVSPLGYRNRGKEDEEQVEKDEE